MRRPISGPVTAADERLDCLIDGLDELLAGVRRLGNATEEMRDLLQPKPAASERPEGEVRLREPAADESPAVAPSARRGRRGSR
jgi:hypothetical protein